MATYQLQNTQWHCMHTAQISNLNWIMCKSWGGECIGFCQALFATVALAKIAGHTLFAKIRIRKGWPLGVDVQKSGISRCIKLFGSRGSYEWCTACMTSLHACSGRGTTNIWRPVGYYRSKHLWWLVHRCLGCLLHSYLALAAPMPTTSGSWIRGWSQMGFDLFRPVRRVPLQPRLNCLVYCQRSLVFMMICLV